MRKWKIRIIQKLFGSLWFLFFIFGCVRVGIHAQLFLHHMHCYIYIQYIILLLSNIDQYKATEAISIVQVEYVFFWYFTIYTSLSRLLDIFPAGNLNRMTASNICLTPQQYWKYKNFHAMMHSNCRSSNRIII